MRLRKRLYVVMSLLSISMKLSLWEGKFVVVAALLCGIILPGIVTAQIPMNKILTTYNQNFDALPASGTGTWESGSDAVIPGWVVQRSKQSNIITANNGSNNTGGLISYGATGSSERALGAISSSVAGEFAWGLLLQNNTDTTINVLDINYWGEQWRISNKTAGEHRITFWYAISSDKSTFNISPTSDNGWTHVPELAFNSPHFLMNGTILDGNAAANKRQLSYLLPVVIPKGHFIMLRWKDADELEADHGLAIDDFTVSWTIPILMPVELVYFKAKPAKEVVQLTWSTASEDQNDYFLIERSMDGVFFESIGKVAGNGTSKNNRIYTSTTRTPPVPAAAATASPFKILYFIKEKGYQLIGSLSLFLKHLYCSAPTHDLAVCAACECLNCDLSDECDEYDCLNQDFRRE